LDRTPTHARTHGGGGARPDRVSGRTRVGQVGGGGRSPGRPTDRPTDRPTARPAGGGPGTTGGRSRLSRPPRRAAYARTRACRRFGGGRRGRSSRPGVVVIIIIFFFFSKSPGVPLRGHTCKFSPGVPLRGSARPRGRTSNHHSRRETATGWLGRSAAGPPRGFREFNFSCDGPLRGHM
jgi:hypothetical protein